MRIADQWIIKNQGDDNAVIDCRYPEGNPSFVSTSTGRGFQPRAVMIRGDATTDGNAAFIRGVLWGENNVQADDFYIAAGAPISLRFRQIYANGTTARGIKILY